MIEAIKQQVTLSTAAGHFNTELLPNKSGQRCPVCNGSSSLKTKDDRYFKCFKCGVSGSVLDYVIAINKAATVSEAVTVLRPLVKHYESPRNFTSLKTKAFNIYKENLSSNASVARDYIESRGWDYNSIDCGLGTKGCLQEAGVSESLLTQIDLWDGYDYYNNHLIFPVYNEHGALVHYSGRAVDPNNSVRWKSSKGTPPIHNYFYNSQALYKPKANYIIVCEGVSDCLSLMQLGEPVIGQFGVNVDLSKHAEHFSKFDFLLFMYDYDRYPLGNQFEGIYKSWSQMMPSVIKLATLIRKPIYHLELPNLSGIKDVNDWLLYIDYDIGSYKQYRNKNTAPISELAVSMYKDDPSKHLMLWRLLSATGDNLMAKKLLDIKDSQIDYLFEVFAFQ